MAGLSKRFSDQGYKLPKYMLDVVGKTLIERVVDPLKILGGQFIFCVLKEHLENKNFDICCLLNRIAPNCIIIPVDKVTAGAVSTCLLAKKYINKLWKKSKPK